MLTDIMRVIPPDPTRRMLLKAVFITSGTALAISVAPLAVASEAVSITTDTSSPMIVDGWLLSADDR